MGVPTLKTGHFTLNKQGLSCYSQRHDPKTGGDGVVVTTRSKAETRCVSSDPLTGCQLRRPPRQNERNTTCLLGVITIPEAISHR